MSQEHHDLALVKSWVTECHDPWLPGQSKHTKKKNPCKRPCGLWRVYDSQHPVIKWWLKQNGAPHVCKEGTSCSEEIPGKLEGTAVPASLSQQSAWLEEGRDLWVEWQVRLPAGRQDFYWKLEWGTCYFFSWVKVVAVLLVCLHVPVWVQSSSWHSLCFLSAIS